MRVAGFVLVMFSASLLAAVGCSSEGGDPVTGQSAQAVQGGTLDTTHTFSVGLCEGTAGSCFGFCSGTLIAPNLVVTARHCVDDSPRLVDCSQNPTFGNPSRPLSQLFVTTNASVSQGGGVGAGWYGVKEIVRPTDDHLCGNDLALLILTSLVPAAEAKPAIPGVQYPMGDARYSTRYAAIGYGITSPTGNDSGTRRMLDGIGVACIPNDPHIPCPAKAQVNANEFVGGDGVCSGDSGSGAFEDKSLTAGAPVSFGIASRAGSDQAQTQCLTSIYTRLDAWRDLVVAAVEKASNDWQLYAKPSPDWTVYVPPPAADAGSDAAPPPPPKAELGEACDTADQCASAVCIDDPAGGGGGVCSKDCVEGAAGACPDGFTCSSAVCVKGVPTKAAPVKTVTKKSGCAVQGGTTGTTGDTGLAAIGLAALGLTLARRRRP